MASAGPRTPVPSTARARGDVARAAQVDWPELWPPPQADATGIWLGASGALRRRGRAEG